MVFSVCLDCGSIRQYCGDVKSYCSKCGRITEWVILRDERYQARKEQAMLENHFCAGL